MKIKSVRSGGSSCWHMFSPSVRMKKPGSHGRHLHWLQMLLFTLLAGQAYCEETSAAPTSLLPLPTITAQTSAHYFLNIAVDVTGSNKEESEIKDWLGQVFQNKLENCISPTHEETTTSQQTTSASTANETTLNTTTATISTTLEINNTTATTFNSNNTTTATTSTMLNFNTSTATSTTSNINTTTATSTMLNINTTTATSTMLNINTTTATSTTLEINNTTATTFNSNNTTTATSAMLNINTTTATTPTTSTRSITTTTPTTLTRSITTTTPTTLTRSITTTTTTTATTPTTLKRSDTTTARADLSTTAALTPINSPTAFLPDTSPVKQVPDGGGDDRQSTKTNSNQLTQRVAREISGSATQTSGPGNTTGLFQGLELSCDRKTAIHEESGAAYVEGGSNSTNCGPDPNKCNCSAYCSRTDAYYTFKMSIQDPNINISYVLSLISKLKQAPPCSPSTDSSCPLSIIATEYKDSHVFCGNTATNLESCRVILGFAHEVPICNLSALVTKVFQSIEQIKFDGLVTRAAICGNSGGDNPLASQFKWVKLNLNPAMFCMAIETSNILTCQTGINVAAELLEQCVQEPFTTPSPNVTTTQPNTTTSSVNVTSSPLNTTAEPLNATTTAANVTVTATTEAAESQANSLLAMTRDVSSLNSSQVDELVSQLEDLLAGPTVSLALGNTSVHIVSNLLGASAETLADSSNRIIQIVDTVGLKLVLEEQAETLLSPAVALSVKPADGRNFQETFFSISDPNNVQVRGDPRLRRSVREDSSIPQGSIRLPPSLTQDLTSEEQQLASRVQFNFYQKNTVFQDRSIGQRKLNSGILGASVANLSIKGLTDDVVIHLRNTEPIPANFVATCVFWDFTLNNESGGWNPKGCSVQKSTDNETVCGCNHLTSFAILLDLSRQPVTSRVQATILTFITYIGCGISAIFLSITLLTYLAFGKLRKDIPSKILIQLCLALLMLNLVFLVDAWLALYPEAVGLCISTAWFLHYFLLVAFTWMGLEAVHMYLALVKVFNSYISRYMLKFSLVGWGVPMIVVIIVIAIDKDNYGLISYGKFPDGTSDDFCWLKNDIAFYVAVVAYFCVVFLFNFIMFIVVLVQLCRIKRQNPHNMQHRSILQDVRSVAGITLLLGLTWGFAFFAWGPVNLPFMYLFAIFNSLQGFFIFVFHCAAKENVRRQWRIYLCCGTMRLAENSEWSRTATQKTVKKSSVTRVTSLHSSKSNNSSSSTSFLVSDSSEQINGIGSPFEDRAITADEDASMDVILNEINRQNRNQ
uniref:Adhesion G-protein coupled receptor G2 n=1 Tax=Seriola lalandi dorsalis TaxID=1841481 RepID=A0A3B4Y887_SERLL